MDVMHPRLLVTRFGDCFRFYDAVLPELIGAHLTRGSEQGPYASWDVGDEGAVMLFDRAAMAEVAGTTHLPEHQHAQDAVMLVSRVSDVDAAHALCLAHGAQDVAKPVMRPAWGPTCRTAHVRDPEGNLLEFQSY
ncbi:glyoxalase/bleomycin resistance/extradiol dioxygenase family protein [Streptomyces ipomoeae]|uniref:VOC family protein n=1 Tax=Streptomyces ipomoeae TaxID=103232 RepID=UPI001146C004|nr:VOC family protein [Streptomyces ipomoeae]MDX2826927.1 glyoxalase/bleomycin resistance/extradiol dioxygenase family protein [Streptomyces ipomoeae]MDX2879563.1 glyoxalase/bleomycin resistance/extradiol dioxygenase family protein [Streptomyces ipomoeae]MDX2939743.1 glyoxalase/bleomycin resistance/extradiol dioxygenase family protein [Streptomyces ipomoeae]TQE25284.1 glyoxalase/bleomycin resistance/extradiol dioxygenase family protein [Streptomyces ipomoeae]